MIEDYVGKVISGDCIEVMAKMPESSVDLIVTSPPYGVGIAYDSFNDDIEFEQYKLFSASWLREAALAPRTSLALAPITAAPIEGVRRLLLRSS